MAFDRVLSQGSFGCLDSLLDLTSTAGRYRISVRAWRDGRGVKGEQVRSMYVCVAERCKVESEEWEMKTGVVIVYLKPSFNGTSLPPLPTLSSTRRVIWFRAAQPPYVTQLYTNVTTLLATDSIDYNKCQSGTPARISIHRHHRSRHPTHQAIRPSSPLNGFISVKSVMPFGAISVSASKSPVTFVQTVSLTSQAPT